VNDGATVDTGITVEHRNSSSIHTG
jgi:hypothetical protein